MHQTSLQSCRWLYYQTWSVSASHSVKPFPAVTPYHLACWVLQNAAITYLEQRKRHILIICWISMQASWRTWQWHWPLSPAAAHTLACPQGNQQVTLVLLSAFYLQGCWEVLSPTRKETSYSDRRFWVSYILFIIISGGKLVLFIYVQGCW
jgi:hypothetical protein